MVMDERVKVAAVGGHVVEALRDITVAEAS